MTGAFATGGLVGFNSSGTITESGTSGDVTGTNGFGLGGITGVNAGNISHSYSSGAISGVTNQGVGGLSGNNYGVISDSHSTSNVIGGSNVGGLVGENGAYIVRSYATGTVNAQREAGGLVGLLQNNATIYRSYATGQVTGTYHVGGLAGNLLSNANVIDSYATGAVSGNGNLGGLAGYIESGVTIGSSYSTGAVTGSGSLGGLVGANNGGAVTNSYWDMTRSGLATSSGGTGLTGSEMQQRASFAGFDFAATWAIYDGFTTPLLRDFLTPLTVTAANATKVYDGVAYSGGNGVSYSTTPDLSKLSGTPTFAGTAQGATNTGNYGIAVSGLYSNQQGYLLNYADGALNIAPKALTVAGTSVASRVYDGTTNATISGGTLAGVLGSDVVTLIQAGSFTSKNVGSAVTVVAADSLGGAGASNYALTQPTGLAADITRRGLTVSVAGIDKVYDGTTIASLSYADNRIAGDVLSASGAGAAYVDRNAGAGKIINASGIALSGTDAANYLLSNTTASTTATITPRPLQVSANGIDKMYDGTTAASVSYADNRIAGDVLSTVSAGAAYVERTAGIGKVVNVSGITLSGTDAANYVLSNSSTSTTATITPRLMIVNAAGIDKVYDGNTSAAVSLAYQYFAGDSVSIVIPAASFADKEVGSAKPVSVGAFVLVGPDAGNYMPAPVAATVASITAAPAPVVPVVPVVPLVPVTSVATVTSVLPVTPPIIQVLPPGAPATQAVQAAVADAQLAAVTGPAQLAMRDDPHAVAARQLPKAPASLAAEAAMPGIADINLTVIGDGLRMPQDVLK